MNYRVYLHVFCSVPVTAWCFPVSYCFPVATGGMSIYHYFKAWDGFSNPKGSLLRSVRSAAIASTDRGSAERDHCWALTD